MSSKVHYEDNLFFLHSILRTVESGLRLDVDTDYFRDKIIEDVFFIDGALMRMFSSLKENPYLINRSSYLRSLRRTVVAFSDFIEQFVRGDFGFRDTVAAYSDRLTTAQRAHLDVRREIDQILDQEEVDDETTSVISSQEYGFLLASDEEDDESAADNAAGG